MKNKLFITILSAFLALSAMSVGVFASLGENDVENIESSEAIVSSMEDAPDEDISEEDATTKDKKGNKGGKGNKFVDEDSDGVCDNFVDENEDGICDNKPAKGEGKGAMGEGKGKNAKK